MRTSPSSPFPSPSSSPSPSPHDIQYLFLSKTLNNPILRIQLFVFLTAILLVVLSFLGRKRRFVRFGTILKYAPKIISILIPVSITYIMGLMYNASTHHVLYPVWAAILVYAYSGVPNMTACDLSDSEQSLSYFCRILPLIVGTIWLSILNKGDEGGLRSILCILLVISALWNVMETIRAFHLASKSRGLPGFIQPLVEHMREAREESDVDSVSMRGCKYVVWGYQETSGWKVVTIEKIWESVGSERLRDMCLSYAFFKLILRRFVQNSPLYESSKANTRRFIRKGLLEDQVERVFSIIEVELVFLFDFFYTKSFVRGLQSRSSFVLSVIQTVALLIYGAGVIVLIGSKGTSLDTKFFGRSLEIQVTRIVMLIFCGFEIWKIPMTWFSNQKTVGAVCDFILRRHNGMFKNMVCRVWAIKDHLCRRFSFLSKPWQRRLGQYSFLDSYDKVPLLAREIFYPLSKLVKLSRAGQYEEFCSVPLSSEVKKAIVASLLPHVQDEALPLSRGTATITRHQLSEAISRSCEWETDAQVVLVWHIATSFCELFKPAKNTDDPDHEHFLVATQLSKYCAHLVCFAPELLPGRQYTTELDFDAAVKQAKYNMDSHDKGLDMRQRYQNMIQMKYPHGSNTNIAIESAALAKALMEQVIASPSLGWRVLAEFWAELLLYLAPSDNAAAHGEYLARGGEFITHIWALLNHAGIVER